MNHPEMSRMICRMTCRFIQIIPGWRIDFVEMIGGASRVPWVKERLPVVLTATETRNMYVSGEKIYFTYLYILILYL